MISWKVQARLTQSVFKRSSTLQRDLMLRICFSRPVNQRGVSISAKYLEMRDRVLCDLRSGAWREVSCVTIRLRKTLFFNVTLDVGRTFFEGLHTCHADTPFRVIPPRERSVLIVGDLLLFCPLVLRCHQGQLQWPHYLSTLAQPAHSPVRPIFSGA